MKFPTCCKDCIYWDIIHEGATTRAREGRCRRHAPTPRTPTSRTPTSRAGEISVDFGAVWPATFDDDWCGEGERAGDMIEGPDGDDREAG